MGLKINLKKKVAIKSKAKLGGIKLKVNLGAKGKVASKKVKKTKMNINLKAKINTWNNFSKRLGNFTWSQAQIAKWVNFMATRLDYNKVNGLCAAVKKTDSGKDNKKAPTKIPAVKKSAAKKITKKRILQAKLKVNTKVGLKGKASTKAKVGLKIKANKPKAKLGLKIKAKIPKAKAGLKVKDGLKTNGKISLKTKGKIGLKTKGKSTIKAK